MCGVGVAEPPKRLLSEVNADSCVVLLQPLDTALTRFLGSFGELGQLFGLSSVSLLGYTHFPGRFIICDE